MKMTLQYPVSLSIQVVLFEYLFLGGCFVSSALPPPTEVSLTALNTSSLNLTWVAPVTNETLTGYNITWTEDQEQASNYSTWFIITNLPEPGKVYTVFIGAIYGGLGSSNHVNVSGNTFPSTPFNISVDARQTNQLTLSWIAVGVFDTCFAWADNASGSNSSCNVQSKQAVINQLPTAGAQYTFNIQLQSMGFNGSVATFTGVTLPSTPFNISVNARQTNQLTLSWIAVGVFDTCFAWADNASGSNSSCNVQSKLAVINQLPTAGAQYTFNIQLQSMGFNGSVATFTGVTLPSTPFNISVDARQTNQLTLSWIAVGVFDTCFAWADNASGSNSSCNVQSKQAVINQLPTAGKQYTFHIQLQSMGFNGSVATFTGVTLPPIPSSPVCLQASNSSLLINILPPNVSFELDGYVLTISSQNFYKYSQTKTLNASTSNVTFNADGLIAGVNYSVSALAKIQNLTSNSFSITYCTTKLNPPFGVVINKTTEAGIDVEWKAPDGNFDGFEVSCNGQSSAKNVSVFNYKSSMNSSGVSFSALCSNATAGALYSVDVFTLLNKTSYRAPSNIVWGATVPYSPRNFTAYPVNTTSIQIELTYGYDLLTSQCTNYKVNYLDKTEVISFSQNVSKTLSNFWSDSAFNFSSIAQSIYYNVSGIANNALNKTSYNPIMTSAWTLAVPVTKVIPSNESLPWMVKIVFERPLLYHSHVWQYVIRVWNITHFVQEININCEDIPAQNVTQINCGSDNGLLVKNETMHCLNETELSYNITDLRPFTNYTMSIEAVNPGGCSEETRALFLTGPSIPSCVNIVNMTGYIDSINLAWKEPLDPNGIVFGYLVTYSYEEQEGKELFTNDTFFRIDGLYPYVNYTVKVAAINQAGPGTYTGCSSSIVTEQTHIGGPFQASLDVKVINSSSANISWNVNPNRRTGPETFYNLTIRDTQETDLVIYHHVAGFDNRYVIVDQLDAYWEYSAEILSYTISENNTILTTSGQENITFRTSQAAPGNVTAFSVESLSRDGQCNASFVKWDAPALRDRNGIITGYKITWHQILLDNSNQSFHSCVNETCNATLTVMPDNKTYVFTIQAITIEEGVAVSETLSSTGSCLPTPVENISAAISGPNKCSDKCTTKSFPVEFEKTIFETNSNGAITFRGLLIREGGEEVNESETFGNHSLYSSSMTWSNAIKQNKIPEYRATPDDWFNASKSTNRRRRSSNTLVTEYIIGQGDCSQEANVHCNGPLPSGRTFRVRSIICTAKGCYVTEYSKFLFRTKKPNPTLGWIAAIVVPVCLIVAGVVIFFMIRRRRHAVVRKKTNGGLVLDSSHIGLEQRLPKPISLESFADRVRLMHHDSDLMFSDEYKEIQDSSPKNSWSEAEKTENRPKNRFVNILPFNCSRVKLRAREDDESASDYINANYLPGEFDNKEYIASQGPMQHTISDFWRMIWQEKVAVIVMLTNLKEKGRDKCALYWPETINEWCDFGFLSVYMTSEEKHGSYVVRRMTASLNGEYHEVVHFHYIAFPDFGVPDDPLVMIDFIGAVRQHIGMKGTPPTIVHCSAGVGRTGTFVALDRLLVQIRQQNPDSVDIFELVLQLRNFRCQMVQTEIQYIFIHDCIKLELERRVSSDGIYNNAYENFSEPIYANEVQ